MLGAAFGAKSIDASSGGAELGPPKYVLPESPDKSMAADSGGALGSTQTPSLTLFSSEEQQLLGILSGPLPILLGHLWIRGLPIELGHLGY